MDHLDTHLATAAIENKYPLAIKAALAIGKKTLNRYYDKTDNSEVFRIAMGTKFLPFLFLFYIFSFLIYFQYCTLVTNSNISRTRDGQMNGLRRRRKLSGPNLKLRMDPRTTQVGQKKMYVLFFIFRCK